MPRLLEHMLAILLGFEENKEIRWVRHLHANLGSRDTAFQRSKEDGRRHQRMSAFHHHY
jgi:predicted ATP-dependent serine protease